MGDYCELFDEKLKSEEKGFTSYIFRCQECIDTAAPVE
jgi:hypothetical protein